MTVAKQLEGGGFMFLILPPTPELAALVKAYWFIEDLPGEHAGHLIRTSPIPLAVLSVNMGRPNAAEDGELVPSVSLLGLQSRSRAWRSCEDTYFVMVMLTIPGLVRLLPHTGSGSADMLLDLGAVVGDAPAQSLKNGVGIEQEPRRIAAFLDRWLISRMMSTAPISEGRQIAMAHSILRSGGTVETAAETAQINRRQLHRLFHRHLGIGPKEVADLERLHSSLKSVQSGCGEPVHGFSDQAHQIRNWQRRLGVTPGAYARASQVVVLPLDDHLGASEQIVVAGMVVIKMGAYEIVDVGRLKSDCREASDHRILRPHFDDKSRRVSGIFDEGSWPASINQDVDAIRH